MKITATEWIRTVTPIIILAAGGLVGWVRLDSRVIAFEDRLDAECARSMAVDAAQDTNLRGTQLAVAEIKRDIVYILEGIHKGAETQEEILRELRK